MKLFIISFLSVLIVSAQTTFSDITGSLTVSTVTDSEDWGSGVSAEDFDDDGDLDIAICAGMSNYARILVNNGNASFSEIKFNLKFHSRTALWLDFNGDHLLDILFVGDCLNASSNCKDGLALFKQEQAGGFTDVTSTAFKFNSNASEEGIFSGASTADVNGDGYLDILVVYTDIASRYFQNNGDGTFTYFNGMFDDGVNKNWTPILYDMDNDGWVDYYQASDLATPNTFWSHDGDFEFMEHADELGLDNAAEDMGVAIGDYDNDGDFDIYVANIQSEKFNRGNVLYRNDDFIFSDVSKASGVDLGGWSWGVTFLDYNNDGYLDIACTNGWNEYDSSRLWQNNGDGTFVDNSDVAQFNDTLMATSLISLDFDRDGDLDMIQTVKSEYHNFGFRLLENNLNNLGDENFIVVKPRMEGTNHWAIGSLVKIVTQNGEQIRPITGGVSYFGQEPAEAFFGLGDVTEIDEVEIIWPGGGKSSFIDILANQVIELNDESALHPPTNLSIESLSESSFELSWQAGSSTEEYYIIERSLDSKFSSYSSVEVESDVTSFVDTGLSPDIIYFYRVKSKKDLDVSRSTIHVKAQFRDEIDTPKNFSVEGVSETSALLSWEDVSNNEDGFLIQRSASSGFESFVEFTTDSNIELFLNEGLEPKSKYFYRLKAFSSYGESEFTDFYPVDLSSILSTPEIADFTIYPNPSNGGIFNINSDLAIEEVLVYDSQGKLYKRMRGEIENEIYLPEGEYYLIFKTISENLFIRKLISR